MDPVVHCGADDTYASLELLQLVIQKQWKFTF